MKRPPLRPGDVYPSHVLRDVYGMNAENRPTIAVNAEEVPADLRDLIPAVERWAISCDVTRGDYFAKQPESDISKFWYDVKPSVERINEWLDQQSKDVREWPDAAVHFMYFLKAHHEAVQHTPDDLKRIENNWAQWNHEREFANALSRGSQAFQSKDLKAVIDALAPFADELDKVMTAKLAYAKKNVKA